MLDTVTEGLAKILQHVWKALFTVDDVIQSKWFNNQLDTVKNYWIEEISKQILKISKSINTSDDMTPALKTTIDGLLSEGTFGSLVAALFYLVPWTTGYIYNTFGITHQDAIRQAAATYLPAVPDMNLLVNILHRHPDKKDEIDKYFRWLGFDPEQQENVMKAFKPILGFNEAIQLLHRGKISPKEYGTMMSSHGFSENEAEQFKELGNYIPAVPDLVRMAVREVFTPSIVEKYGQAQDFPPEFLTHAATQGLSADWAKAYWAAHWELPSLQMGYEMLHRQIISPQDLDELMRSQDVMPFWRDKLKQISYRPYSRVDVRRMHAFGVLNDEQVLTAYKDLGYDPEKAQKMADFTIAYNNAAEKDLSKGELLDALKKGLMEKNIVNTKLIESGYDTTEAKLLIDRALYEKEKEEKELSLSYVKAMYMNGVYYESDVEDALGKMNLASKEQDNIMKLWGKLKATKVKRLTPKELLSLWQAKIITPIEWRAEMRKLHYTEKSVEWLELLYSDVEEVAETKDLSLSHIKELYLKYIYEEADAKPLLKGMKLSDDKVNDLIDLWDLLREEAKERKEKALSREEESRVKELGADSIRKLFMADIYDASEATKHLSALKMTDTQIFDLLALWKYDKEQIAIKEAAVLARREKTAAEKAERERVAAEKAAIREEEKRVRELGIADIKKLYVAGIYDVTEVKQHLRLIKIAEDEINDLIQLWDLKKTSQD